MFKNLQAYRMQPLNMEREDLIEKLESARFHPCAKMDMESRGWVPPIPNGELVHEVDGHWLVALCVERKILPGSVIRQEVEERAKLLEEQEGYRPGRKQMRELKERIIEELLPRAFATRVTTLCWLDNENGWMGVDASSKGKAEELFSTLNKAVDDLQVRLLQTNLSPATAMSTWLDSGEPPTGFTIDRDCALKAEDGEKSSVTFSHHVLDPENVQPHLHAGKRPIRLGLTWDDRLSFVLTDKFDIKRIALTDVMMEEATENAETADEVYDANFLMIVDEFVKLLPALIEALGGEVEPA